LDGSDRKVVLAGTGEEDKYNTSLLASRDWKYLALLSKRSGNNASVYLIDTTDGDKLTTIDQGNANFSLVGWSGSRFVYRVDRNGLQPWQPNQQALKSFDASNKQTLLLDQTQAIGVDANDYANQYLGEAYVVGNQVVYTKNWRGIGFKDGCSVGCVWDPNNAAMKGKQAELDAIGVDGSSHKVLKSFSLANPPGLVVTAYVTTTLQPYEPSGLYVSFDDGNGYKFFKYEDGQVSDDTALTQTAFYGTDYPTHLLSPSGSNTFWGEKRDGKNVLFTGDDDGKAPKQIASLSEYSPFGWFTDNYLLVSKSSSELYIMPATGGTPQKITDYYKPDINYQGYGGGYGGL
jgi:hypothetical protein